MPKSRTCFIHVPKSGGSSVISNLRTTLGPTFFHANESRYQQAPLEVLLNGHSVIAGHFTFAQVAEPLLNDTFFFTFLRDPVDRVLSHYYFYRSQTAPKSYDTRVALARELDLEPFVAGLPNRPSPWSNWQTFIFSGAADSETPADALLPAALRNLERLDFVGVHDDFDEGFRSLCELRGWCAPSALPRVNVTADRLRSDQVPRAVLDRLTALNACDMELFAHAQKLWRKRKSTAAIGAFAEAFAPAAATPATAGRAEHGTREIVITGVDLRAPSRANGTVHENDPVCVEIRGHSHIAAQDVTVGIRLTDELGVEVYGTNTRLLNVDVPLQAGQDFELAFAFEMRLAAGTYRLTVAVHAADDHLHKCYHWIDNALAFECRRDNASRFSGLVNLRAQAVLHAPEFSRATGGA